MGRQEKRLSLPKTNGNHSLIKEFHRRMSRLLGDMLLTVENLVTTGEFEGGRSKGEDRKSWMSWPHGIIGCTDQI